LISSGVGRTQGTPLQVYGINGPVVTVLGKTDLSMGEMVFVGKKRLIGEVINISDEKTTIQVYENTTGLYADEPIENTGYPIRADLGPGMLSNIYDGIQRPLKVIENISGHYIKTGINVPSIDYEKKWDITVFAKEGDKVNPGDIYAECNETSVIKHKFMIPYGVSGTVCSVGPSGEYCLTEEILQIKTESGETAGIALTEKWPIRKARPVRERLEPKTPLITGQRVIDALFPIAKGGAAAIPGGFGTGKTVLQHQLAKWSDADIIVYIGCGERGNEMTDVINEFRKLIDPQTNKPLMERTILIANTSNMPVAAREASIYTGITIAEYYRDMGYDVAIMADSTSRWAEALREMSGRLEEMPGDEGYPAYLGSRLSNYYERAGRVVAIGRPHGREGSVTAISAVSPPGGDISEPVTQNTLRVVKVFWGLDATLARQRHFPSINWMNSYSLYADMANSYYDQYIDENMSGLISDALNLLQEENRLLEIVKLVGFDSISDIDKLKLEISKSIREDYLQQNAFNPIDAHSSLRKQFAVLRLIIDFYKKSLELIEKEIINFAKYYTETASIRERIGRVKFIPEKNIEEINAVGKDMYKILEAIKLKLNVYEKEAAGEK